MYALFIFTEEKGLVESIASFEFKLNEDGKGYTLIGKGTCTAAEIVIDGYKGLPVTSIGDWAFLDCSSLTSIKYRGTEEQWTNISVVAKIPSSCTITYNYTGE